MTAARALVPVGLALVLALGGAGLLLVTLAARCAAGWAWRGATGMANLSARRAESVVQIVAFGRG